MALLPKHVRIVRFDSGIRAGLLVRDGNSNLNGQVTFLISSDLAPLTFTSTFFL